MPTTLHAVKSPVTPAAASSATPGPLALWHLLSLDAPSVAAVWTWFVARATHTPLPHAILVAMFLAVWLLYASDRLLDATRATAGLLEPRHLFHQKHHRAFTAAILIVSATLTPLVLEIAPQILRLYLVLAAVLLLWFLLIHIFARNRTLPKELIPGPFFAAAVFLPVLSPETFPTASAFALLCTLNCLSIYAWEHPQTCRAPSIAPLRWVGTPHLTTRLGVRFLTPITAFAILLPLALLPLAPAMTPILLALSLAATLLFALNRIHTRLHPTNLRAAADLVLLTPLLIAPFLR